MGTPARTSILADIAATLATITVANGYKSTVAQVDRYLRDYDDVDASDKPWLGFFPGPERAEHRFGGCITMTLPVTIVGHVSVASTGAETVDQTARTVALSNLQDDVIAALSADIRRGGNAIETRLSGIASQTDEGVPEHESDAGGSASIQLTFEVVYDRTTGSS